MLCSGASLGRALWLRPSLQTKARAMSSVTQAAMDWKGLRMKGKGEPLNVLELSDLAPTPDPAPGQVLVRMLASPVNPRYVMSYRPIIVGCLVLCVSRDRLGPCRFILRNLLLSSP